MNYGRFEFRLPVNDTQGITPGDLIGITSSYGAPSFLGGVDLIRETDHDATVHVSGRELSAVLSERLIAQQQVYSAAAGGDIARDMLRRAAGRNQTGIIALPTGSSSPIISPFISRSETILDGLAELSSLTGWEWDIRYTLGVKATASFVWQQMAGDDLRNTVHLCGCKIASADYQFDAVSENKLVQIVGALGNFSTRPAAVAVFDGPVSYHAGLASVRIPVAADRSRRQAQRQGVTTAREVAVLEPTLTDGIAVQRRAHEAIRLAQFGAETMGVTATTETDWSLLRAGNIVTVRLGSMRFGDGVVRPFRIHGMQPNNEAGVVELIGKVLPSA
jgi:hypothetical protein